MLRRALTAYGHSWVAGEGASRPSRGLVEVAAGRLGLRPDNRGVGGSHSSDTAARVVGGAPASASVCVVLTGLNDARQNGADPGGLTSYGAALGEIFTALQGPGTARLVIAVEQPPLVDYSLHPPHHRGSNEVLDLYNERLRTVAARHPGLVVAPVDGWDPATMLAVDTVHPNDAGHGCVARAIVHAVSTARPERSR